MLYFRFRFVNNIPAGMEPKKPNRANWAWSQVRSQVTAKLNCKAGVLVLTDRELERVKKWFQGRGWRVKIGDRDGEGRKNTPAHSHCLFGERPCTGYTGGALLGAVSDVSIASCQSRSHDRSHRNTHFPRLLVIRWFIQILSNLILPWKNSFSS